MTSAHRELPPELERAVGERVPCATHPGVETSLRCMSCGRAICPKCLIHTTGGAQCPTCARRSARRGSVAGPVRTGASVIVGLAVAAAGGAGLGVFPPGPVIVIPTLLLGFLVGEAVAATAGRQGGALLAVVGLVCGSAGPLAGRALVSAVPLDQMALATQGAFSAQPQSPFGLLLLMGCALIATFRAATPR